MTETVVVTDSSADIDEELTSALGIWLLPMHIYVGMDINPSHRHTDTDEFWSRVSDGAGLVRTAQLTPGDFSGLYRKIAAEFGPDVNIISVHASENFSGSLQSATVAAETLDELNIRVIDSGLIGPPMGQLAAEVASFSKEGHSVEEIIDFARSLASRIEVLMYATGPGQLTDIDSNGWLDAMIDLIKTPITPNVFKMKRGRIEPVRRAKSVEDVVGLMLDMIEHSGNTGRGPHLVGSMFAGSEPHSNLTSQINEVVNENVETKEFLMGPVLGSHLGHKSLGVFRIA